MSERRQQNNSETTLVPYHDIGLEFTTLQDDSLSLRNFGIPLSLGYDNSPSETSDYL
ncbi:13067_t:CDS:1, partial [Ambispora gerdemannii]